ncbi:hypothetical protein [Paludisphaera soli]|uniref:hypothetical protein n=1 Tax=Paludisphaera soli TaxID=2712865 RepID=UPI0013EB6090|nr:hypothetical protein [Paludisphaera soli]
MVLAMGYGTSYGFRLPEVFLPEAVHAGCKTSHRWHDGKVTDLSTEVGPDWVFGCWAKDEMAWCQAAAYPPTS